MLALALSLNVAACATTSHRPVVAAASEPSSAPTDEIYSYDRDGHQWIAMTRQFFGDMLAGVEIEKGPLYLELKLREIDLEAALRRVEAMAVENKRLEWQATWLPVIASAATAAAMVTLVLIVRFAMGAVSAGAASP